MRPLEDGIDCREARSNYIFIADDCYRIAPTLFDEWEERARQPLIGTGLVKIVILEHVNASLRDGHWMR